METTIARLKRISKMPFSTICRKIYCKIKKKKRLPPGTVFDANIRIVNLQTCRDEGRARFSGDFITPEKNRINWITVYSRGVFLGKVKPGKTDSRKRITVEIEVTVSPFNDVFEFYVEYGNGSGIYLGNLEIPYLTGLSKFENELAKKSQNIAVPPADIIFLTQGHREADVYLRSVPRGVYKLKRLFDELGIPFEKMRTILDFGCGSGRLLRGFYADDPSRSFFGADYNNELITWAKQHLPPEITFIKNELDPPLQVEDGKFDLIYLVSVFTHLQLPGQQKWLSEFKRILKSDGILVISLHGMAYLYEFRRNGSESYEDLMTTGYSESYKGSDAVSGSNQYVTAHMPEYVCKTLFKDWKILACLPGGKLRNQLATFDILGFSGVQDIYVLSP